jgi:hypothetical protein
MIFELKNIESQINLIEENVFLGNEKKMVKTISETDRHIIDFKKNIRSHEET